MQKQLRLGDTVRPMAETRGGYNPTGAIPLCADYTYVKFKNARKIFENFEEDFGILLFFAAVRHSRIEWIQH